MLRVVTSYNKPEVYDDQATVDTVNSGTPFYVGSPKFGYEGKYVPIAGSVSHYCDVNQTTGVVNTRSIGTDSLWVTCTESEYQFNYPYIRHSLRDNGVVHATSTDRLAFLTEESARYYSETGKIKQTKRKQMKKSDLKTGMVVRHRSGKYSVVMLDTYHNTTSQIVALGSEGTNDDIGGYTADMMWALSNGTYHLDIMAVYELKCLVDMHLSLFRGWSEVPENTNYKLIWSRDNATEMTMEEVCEALGKQIKIVK